MKCKIHIYLLNEHFSQEHADAQHGGRESENNQRYEWEDELAVSSEVTSVKEMRNAVFPLQGQMPDGDTFFHEVKNMFLVEIESRGFPSTYVGCSESILDSYSINKEGDTTVVKFFIKDYEPMANRFPEFLSLRKSFPKN